jgi:septum site-determining protein MinD
MAKTIVITSGKGGVGKTTIVTNMARRLAYLNYRVLVVDADFGLNNIDMAFGLEREVVYDLADVLDGKCRLKQALLQDKNFNNLYVLPSDKLYLSKNVTSESIKASILVVGKLFDYILIDSPAGIEDGFYRAVACADSALVVVTSGAFSLRDADKVISVLKSYKLDKIGIVVNKVRGDLLLNKKCFGWQEIEEILKQDVIGVIPDSDEVLFENGLPLPRRCEVSKAFNVLAKNVISDKKEIFDVTKKYRGFLGSIRRSLRGGV